MLLHEERDRDLTFHCGVQRIPEHLVAVDRVADQQQFASRLPDQVGDRDGGEATGGDIRRRSGLYHFYRLLPVCPLRQSSRAGEDAGKIGRTGASQPSDQFVAFTAHHRATGRGAQSPDRPGPFGRSPRK